MVRSLFSERAVIPAIAGVLRGGGTLDTTDLRRKRLLAVFFLTAPDPSFFARLDEAGTAFRERQAETLVVCTKDPAVIETACRGQRVTFPIVCDPERAILRRFVETGPSDAVAALFVTDRKGTLFHQTVTTAPRDLPPFGDILRFIDLINAQNPAV